MIRNLAALLLVLFCTAVFAQAPAATRIRGVIEKLDGNALNVKARDGRMVAIKLAQDATIIGVVPASLADVTSGKFIGVTSMPRPDGALMALEIHIFAESMRGRGEGHHAMDPKSENTMTNATVANVVGNAKDRTLTLRYKDSEKKVFVAEGVPIVLYVAADRSALKPGAHVSILAERGTDGSLTTPRINVGLNGLVLPM